MNSLFILTSTVLALISPLVYIRAILKGKAKPHRTTRIVFLFITFLTTLSLFFAHDRVAIYLAGVSFIQSIAIFILSLKYGMGGWAKKDIVCLLIAFSGMILWQTTKNPVIALYSAIAADFTGTVPTLIKTYHYPHTEIYLFYAIDVVAACFSLLAVSSWQISHVAYPLYIMLINLAVATLVVRKDIIVLVKKALFSEGN